MPKKNPPQAGNNKADGARSGFPAKTGFSARNPAPRTRLVSARDARIVAKSARGITGQASPAQVAPELGGGGAALPGEHGQSPAVALVAPPPQVTRHTPIRVLSLATIGAIIVAVAGVATINNTMPYDGQGEKSSSVAKGQLAGDKAQKQGDGQHDVTPATGPATAQNAAAQIDVTPTPTPPPVAVPQVTPRAIPAGARIVTGFTNPSGEVACLFQTEGPRCTVMGSVASNYCPEDKVMSLQIDSVGQTMRDCSIPIKSTELPRLANGFSVTDGKFACTSQGAAIECWYPETGHGFNMDKHNPNSF